MDSAVDPTGSQSAADSLSGYSCGTFVGLLSRFIFNPLKLLSFNDERRAIEDRNSQHKLVAWPGGEKVMQKLLIVDDDQAVHMLARESLSDQNTECIDAFDGDECLRMARDDNPDIILLDRNLPRLSGYQTCRRLKANPATEHIPVIFLTAIDTVADTVMGLDLGAADYITKPFDTAELRARVTSVLRLKRSLNASGALAATDELTGLFNRHYLERRMESDLAASRRTGRPLVCCLVKINDWDRVKEDLGQAASDSLLETTAEAITGVLRREDVVCRYDSDTFAVLAFVTDRLTAIELGQRVRSTINAAGLSGHPNVDPISTNIGLALSRYSYGSSLLHEAEHAMQNAQGVIRFGDELFELQMTCTDPWN